MTRFRELRRIDAAIEHENMAELRWAAAYCEMRLKHATMKHHHKYWTKIERRVQSALEKANREAAK